MNVCSAHEDYIRHVVLNDSPEALRDFTDRKGQLTIVETSACAVCALAVEDRRDRMVAEGFELLQDWYDYWLSDPDMEPKLPDALHVRTAVLLTQWVHERRMPNV